MTRRSSTHRTARQYPRIARVNELVHQIVADELERLDDARLELVTVMDVVVEPDLRHATVLYSSPRSPDADEEIQAALAESRPRLQAAIGRQARMKRTPELSFRVDTVVRQAARVEEIIRQLHDDDT